MTLDLGSRLGLAGVVLALFSIAAFYLWPEKRWIGWICLILAAALLLVWGVIEIKLTKLGGRLSPYLAILLGAVIGGLIAYCVWNKIANQRKENIAKPTVPSEGPPLVLPAPFSASTEHKPNKKYLPHRFKDVFDFYQQNAEFPHVLRKSQVIAVHSAQDDKDISVGESIYLDFEAHVKFVGFYVPLCSDTFGLIRYLVGNYDRLVKELSTQGMTAGGDPGTDLEKEADMPFSGRVFFFYEGDMTMEQKGEIAKRCSDKGLSVGFRDRGYVAMK